MRRTVESGHGRGRLFVAAAISPYAAHDYLYYRGLRMLNTFYPYLLRGFFPNLMAFVLARWPARSAAGGSADIGEPCRFLQKHLAPARGILVGLATVAPAHCWNEVDAAGSRATLHTMGGSEYFSSGQYRYAAPPFVT